MKQVVQNVPLFIRPLLAYTPLWRRCAIGLLLCGILIFAFFVRFNTFWLPHWVGDQSHYLTLALKLDKLGFNYYNLRGIHFEGTTVDPHSKIYVAFPVLMKDLNARGDLITAMKIVGVNYYDQDFFHKPPAFPFMLVLSHRFFAKPHQPYSCVVTNVGKFLHRMRPRVLVDAQFYAVIIPFFFSLALIVVTFIFGTLCFSSRIGLYAALLMAINPVDITTSQRLWNDDMLAFFVTLAFVFFWLAFVHRQEKHSYLALLCAGLTCGIAILVKQTGGFVLIVAGIFSALFLLYECRSWKRIPLIFVNRFFLITTIGAFVVSGFWFLKIYQLHGNPFWLPVEKEVFQTDLSGWFKALARRPTPWILYPVGMVYLMPLSLFAFFTLKRFVIMISHIIRKQTMEWNVVYLWTIILVLYIAMSGMNNKEHRYMLPVYPAIAILSAFCMDRFRLWLTRHRPFRLPLIAELCVLVLVTFSAWRTVPLGITAGLEEFLLLRYPF